MRREWANRIVFVLVCVGAFVALVTGIGHAAQVELPCGPVKGCNIIGLPENSHWFNIPIAFYGLGLYLFIALCAMARAVLGPINTPRLGSAMWAMLGVGTVVSISLIAYAFNVLHASCLWCLVSAAAMTLAFFVHTYGIVGEAAERTSNWPFIVYPALLVGALGAGGAYGAMLAQGPKLVTQIEQPADAQYFLPESHVFGDPNAPITIVEFADLYCPSCRSQHQWLEPLLNGPYKGKVKLVLRHWPVYQQHKHAVAAAMLSEWAAEQGKFEEFVHAVHTIEDNDSLPALLGAVEAAGLDKDAAAALMGNDQAQTKYLERVQKDIADGNKLGVESTPTWFVLYPNKEGATKAVADGIRQVLMSSEFEQQLASASSR